MKEEKLDGGWGLNERMAPKVSRKKKIAYTVNQIGINSLWQAFNTVAVFFYVTVLKVPGVEISVVMIVYGIVNAFLNLIAGHISDRTRTRFGRRIPYIAIGTLPFAAAFYLLFAPPHIGQTGLLIFFIVMTFLFDLFFTFTALNAGALFPEMYPDEKERAYVSALQQVFGIVGTILGVALSKSLGTALGWHTMALIFAGIGVLSLYVSLYGSFENKKNQENPFQLGEALKATFQNKRFVVYVVASFLIQFTMTLFTGVSSFYTKYVVPLDALQNSLFLGGIFIVAMPVSFIWARVAIRMTAAKASRVAVAMYMIIALLFLVERTPLELFGQCLLMGFPISGFMVLLTILLAEIVDHDAKKTGRRREGMYLGMNGFIVRLGMSLQYAVMAIFFQVSGYNANSAVQNSRTIWGFRLLLGAVPFLFLCLAFVLLAYYVRVIHDEGTPQPPIEVPPVKA